MFHIVGKTQLGSEAAPCVPQNSPGEINVSEIDTMSCILPVVVTIYREHAQRVWKWKLYDYKCVLAA